MSIPFTTLKAFEMKHYLLENKEFLESHSAANIADELQGIVAEWNLLDDNTSAITTDNGRNISAAARELSWTNLPCFSHTLQLGVEKVLKLPHESNRSLQNDSHTLSPFQQIILYSERFFRFKKRVYSMYVHIQVYVHIYNVYVQIHEYVHTYCISIPFFFNLNFIFAYFCGFRATTYII